MAKTFTSNWTTKTGLNHDSQYNLSKRDVHRAREAFRDAADDQMEIQLSGLDALLRDELGLRLTAEAFARACGEQGLLGDLESKDAEDEDDRREAAEKKMKAEADAEAAAARDAVLAAHAEGEGKYEDEAEAEEAANAAAKTARAKFLKKARKKLEEGGAPLELDGTMAEAGFMDFFSAVYAPAYRDGGLLIRAAARGEHGKMADLISRGCSPDASDGRGMTPLHYASEAGRAETVTELRNLWPELRLDASDSSGWTPLMCAAANGHTATVLALAKAGADVCAANNQGRTALHWAACKDHAEAAQVLLQNGADVDAPANNGWTPLHCAALHQAGDAVQVLLDARCDVEALDQCDKPAAHFAGEIVLSVLSDHASGKKKRKKKK